MNITSEEFWKCRLYSLSQGFVAENFIICSAQLYETLRGGALESVWHQFSLVKHTCPQPVTGLVFRLVFTGSIPVPHTNLWFQKHLVKQSWPPDGCRRTEGRLKKTLSEKGACFLPKKEALSDPSEWWWEEWWRSRESLWLLAIGYRGYPIRAYRC